MRYPKPMYIIEDEENNLLRKRYRHTDFRTSKQWGRFSRKNTSGRDKKSGYFYYGVSKKQYKANSLLEDVIDYWEHAVGKSSI